MKVNNVKVGAEVMVEGRNEIGKISAIKDGFLTAEFHFVSGNQEGTSARFASIEAAYIDGGTIIIPDNGIPF